MKKILYPCFITLAAIALKASPYAPERVSDSSLGDLIYAYNTTDQRLDYISEGMRASQSIEWGLVDKAVKIKTTDPEGDLSTVSFRYGPAGNRNMRISRGKKILYVGGVEYDVDSQTITAYFRNGSYSPVAKVEISDGTREHEYFVRDNLGNSLLTVDDSGNVIEGKSHGRYDPWGQPWQADGTVEELKEDSRGFTGHENVSFAGMIHMNGRMYDPMLGQFTAPDVFIQNASIGVGLNRYAYIGNSPVNGIDPTGWVGVGSILNQRNIDAIVDFTSNNFVNWWDAAKSHPYTPEVRV